jgi:hypothetical protein
VSEVLCTGDGCKRKADTRGMCRTHYERALRNGLIKKITRSTVCSLAGCSKERYGRGLCTAHYHRQYRTRTTIKQCSSEGCDRNARTTIRKETKGLCNKCYCRVYVAKKKAVDMPMPALVAASVQRSAIKETRRKRLAKRGIVPFAF